MSGADRGAGILNGARRRGRATASAATRQAGVAGCGVIDEIRCHCILGAAAGIRRNVHESRVGIERHRRPIVPAARARHDHDGLVLAIVRFGPDHRASGF